VTAWLKIKNMAKPKSKGGIGHVRDAARYSMQGFGAMWKHEESFRLEVFIYTPFILVAPFVGTSLSHVALLISLVLLIFMAEAINSAIEAVVDRFGDEIHPLSGRAKDCGTAASFAAQSVFVIIWLAALYEKFMPMFVG